MPDEPHEHRRHSDEDSEPHYHLRDMLDLVQRVTKVEGRLDVIEADENRIVERFMRKLDGLEKNVGLYRDEQSETNRILREHLLWSAGLPEKFDSYAKTAKTLADQMVDFRRNLQVTDTDVTYFVRWPGKIVVGAFLLAIAYAVIDSTKGFWAQAVEWLKAVYGTKGP